MKEGINQLNEPSCFFTSCSPSMFFLVNSSQGFFYFVLFSFFFYIISIVVFISDMYRSPFEFHQF